MSVVTLDVLALEVALHERLVLGLLDDPLDELARASSAPSGACPAGVCESSPYSPVIDSPSRIGR